MGDTLDEIRFQKPSLAPEFVKPQSHIQVIGFPERNKAVSWEPSPELVVFLERHKKLLLLSFGSMTNAIPKKMTQMFLNVLTQLGIPAIINTGVGALLEPSEYSRESFFLPLKFLMIGLSPKFML